MPMAISRALNNVLVSQGYSVDDLENKLRVWRDNHQWLSVLVWSPPADMQWNGRGPLQRNEILDAGKNGRPALAPKRPVVLLVGAATRPPEVVTPGQAGAPARRVVLLPQKAPPPPKPDFKSFPYKIDRDVSAVMAKELVDRDPNTLSIPSLEGITPEQPVYLINLPHVPPRAEKVPYTRLNNIIQMLREDSFGTATERADSGKMASRRISVLVGANRMQSIDRAENEQFYRYIREAQPDPKLSVNMFGNLWVPTWKKRKGFKGEILPLQRAFDIVKSHNPEAAERVKTKVERLQGLVKKDNRNADKRLPIPWQRIRNMILRHPDAEAVRAYVAERAPHNPVFWMTMDDDFQALRKTDGLGLFSYYDRIIQDWKRAKKQFPQIVSTGYFAAETEAFIYQAGIIIDMWIRQEMAKIFPTAPYYPEPGFVMLLRDKLSKYSYLGSGDNQESVRLIDNAIREGLLEPEHVVFQAVRALITALPNRFRTIKNETKLSGMSAKKIGQLQALEALRGMPQSHLFPKVWAEGIYRALPIKMKTSDFNRTAIKIMHVFDPIFLATEQIKTVMDYRTYNAPLLKLLLDHYDRYVELITHALNNPTALRGNACVYANLMLPKQAPGSVSEVRAAQEEKFVDFFKTQTQEIDQARIQLQQYGLSADCATKVVLCAKATGKAVEMCLAKWIN